MVFIYQIKRNIFSHPVGVLNESFYYIPTTVAKIHNIVSYNIL